MGGPRAGNEDKPHQEHAMDCGLVNYIVLRQDTPMKKEFVFEIEQDGDMLVAVCHRPEMTSQGENLDELLAMIDKSNPRPRNPWSGRPTSLWKRHGRACEQPRSQPMRWQWQGRTGVRTGCRERTAREADSHSAQPSLRRCSTERATRSSDCSRVRVSPSMPSSSMVKGP
jgi:hypothetical protein